MQAVIIAGGLGTRLRPLTFNRPKALVPLLNRAQILHILDRLPKAVDEVFVAVNYMHDRIREFFKEADAGRSVQVIEEPTPLGTGGAGKNVPPRLDGTFAVDNGGVVDSLDFSKFLAFHRKHEALATIALYEVPDPSAVGVVALDRFRVLRLVQKPAPGAAAFPRGAKSRAASGPTSCAAPGAASKPPPSRIPCYSMEQASKRGPS